MIKTKKKLNINSDVYTQNKGKKYYGCIQKKESTKQNFKKKLWQKLHPTIYQNGFLVWLLPKKKSNTTTTNE